MTSYTGDYIDECRSKIDEHIASYRRVVATGAKCGGAAGAAFDAALRDFEPVFFNSLVLVLENYFVHRSRAMEKKDGNPMNEVRVLSNSLTSNDGRLVADTQIKLPADKSLLGYAVGDQIQVRQDDFARLAKAYFAEIETTFA